MSQTATPMFLQENFLLTCLCQLKLQNGKAVLGHLVRFSVSPCGEVNPLSEGFQGTVSLLGPASQDVVTVVS